MTEMKLVGSYLESLADNQDYAAEKIESAKDATKGIVTDLWFSHGPICGQAVTAIEDLEKVRKQAARTMVQVSDALAENLNAAAQVYGETDTQNSSILERQILNG